MSVSKGLALRGTIVVSDPRYSEALVDLGGGDLHRVRIGGPLGQYGTLVEVRTQSILIRRNGQIIEFTFNDSSFGGAGTVLAFAGDAGGDGAGVDGSGADDVSDANNPGVVDPGHGFVWRKVDTGPPKQIDEWIYEGSHDE